MPISKKSIQKIVVANRGEIAIRIMQTAHRLGISTVAVYSEADKNALFVQQADEAFCIGGFHPADSYLNMDKIIEVAHITKADAIHPGYGFLSENETFAQRCATENIIFIGPTPEAIYAMGDKKRAKEIVAQHQVPIIPGYNGQDQNVDVLIQEAKKIGFPLLLKASAGGGGKGMRVVHQEKDLKKEIESAQRESKSAFGDDTLLIEKYFPRARHIEFQIFGDSHGNIVHLFERECSVQRRHQKIIEESPAPNLPSEIRKSMSEAAVNAAKSIRYTNAGTVEFIYIEPDSSTENKAVFYFLEVNTRLQVEHPVTERITGLDLVQWQIEIAEGKTLPLLQHEIQAQGHALEVRLYAENPYQKFMPSTGEVLYFKPYHLAHARFDSGIQTGSNIDVFYDPMLAKIITHDSSREGAIRKMIKTLRHTIYAGTITNLHFLQKILEHPDFLSGNFDTSFLQQNSDLLLPLQISEADVDNALIAATLIGWQQREQQRKILKPLPSGWRNLSYQNQIRNFILDEKTYCVQYQFIADNKFVFSIQEKKFDVVLENVALPQISVTINHHRSTFHICRKKNICHVHHANTGTLIFDEIHKFPEPVQEKIKGAYTAPMPGEILKVLVKEGDEVQPGDPLVVMLSMKMESTIEASESGKIKELYVAEKNFVEADTLLLKIAVE